MIPTNWASDFFHGCTRSGALVETYQSGIKVSDAELAQVKIRRDKFHGDWNYEIQPRNPSH